MATKDVSIVVSARDNYSAAIDKMNKTQNLFARDMKGLQTQLDQLNRNKVTLRTDFNQANNALKEAKKAFADTTSEANRLQLEAAQADYDNIAQNLGVVSKAAKDTQKDLDKLTKNAQQGMNDLAGTSSKVQNQMSGNDGLLKSLAGAGMIKMLGDQLGNTAGVLVSSAFGAESGTLINSLLGGTASGAALGFTAGGPVGALIGGGVGALAGLIGGMTQNYQSQDEAYKAVVQDTFNEVMQNRAASLISGTDIAGRREIDQMSFTTLFGDSAVAEAFLESVRGAAAKTPFGYDTLTAMSKTLKTYGYGADDIMPLLMQVGDAGAALGMSEADMGEVATYIGRMRMTDEGSVTKMMLDPLMRRGLPVFDYLAQAFEVTNAEAQEMVTKGLIPGAEAAKIIASYMGDAFGGAMDLQAQTYTGLVSNLEDLQADADAAMGKGYTDTRKKGLEDQIAYMEGESGDKLKDANYLIGVWQGTLENEQDRALREAYDKAFEQIETEGITNEAEMGRILGEAQASAKADYLTSSAVELETAAQIGLAEAIQSDMALTGAWENAGYKMGQVFSQGMASALAKSLPSALAPGGIYTAGTYVSPISAGNNAFGLDRVPYDGFPALLHEGERVLTAAEARRQDNGGSAPQVTISGNTFTVREDADIYKIATAIVEQIEQAGMSFVGG